MKFVCTRQQIFDHLAVESFDVELVEVVADVEVDHEPENRHQHLEHVALQNVDRGHSDCRLQQCLKLEEEEEMMEDMVDVDDYY